MPLRLEQLRRRKRLSQRELSRRAGVSRSYINELEKGIYDPTKIICKLCRTLNCTPNDMIIWEVNEYDK